ncbi:hypothetical protein Ct61P_00492 [Colletotrichum tofieldiae]|nr:hypothetical protein Ct61P_00492 [Colletotrichum tofieldiae]
MIGTMVTKLTLFVGLLCLTGGTIDRGSILIQTSEKNLLAPESEATTNNSDGATSPDKTQLYKELYYKLQNLEKYPGILPKARRVLIGLLHEGLLIE